MYRIFLAVSTLCISISCLAQDSAGNKPVYDSTSVYKPMDPWDSTEWVVTLTPYAWFPEFHGNVTLNGFKSDVDVDFHEILDHLDFAAMGRIEFWKDDWSFFVDSFYTKLSADYTLRAGPLAAKFNLDFRLSMTDVGLSYKLLDTSVGKSGEQRLVVTPYAGGRYSYLKDEVNVDPEGPFAPIVGDRTIGGSEDWVEPFGGGRVIWRITKRFFAAARGDAGGFGIGSASQLTWNAVGWLGYAINENVSLEAGYRILDVDYSHGSGRDKQGLDAQLRGPIAGLTIKF